ncbi:MAG: 4Fe-4S binding protein [Actinobacteria bacterium]|nr:4Fe-4S binding protein [Actinomycetota bacterium]
MRCDVTATLREPADPAAIGAGTICPVQVAADLLWQAARLSCGREVYCREGPRQVATILSDIGVGRGSSTDLELVEELCSLMVDVVPCGSAKGAARTTLDLLHSYPEEWERHVLRGRCTSLTCTMSFTVHVDPATCTGCQACLPVCPVGAIRGGEGLIHVVDVEACTRCGACLAACPVDALAKAGPIKPRQPVDPVPVGSFAGPAPGSGMRRRRRGA